MSSRAIAVLSALALAATVTACSDVTSPTSGAAPSSPRFSGGPVASSGSGPATGGSGGQSSKVTPPGCGTFTTQTFFIGVYTTRTGIGFGGSATNCGTSRESLEVSVVDDNTDPVCSVNVPHSLAARPTSAGASTVWRANSTLVRCQNTMHTFTLTLRDTQTNTDLATSTTSFFF